MSPYCPRCDVQFEKDLPRCPACGWDFRAHIFPPDFLKPPINFTPLKELGEFVGHNIPLIWVNGLAVELVWIILVLVFYRAT